MGAVPVVYFSVQGGESDGEILVGGCSDPPGDEVGIVSVVVEVPTRTARERNLVVKVRRGAVE